MDRKEYNKHYYQINKEKRQKQMKEYHQQNKEKLKEYYKKYSQTEKGKKSTRIRNWKFSGVIHPNFDELYEKYINTEHCELCSVELTEDRYRTPTTRVLDHCHETGEFRNIVCQSCNIKRR
jgi:hypothetical protein